VYSGIISLAVMAALCAFGLGWVLRRMGVAVSRNTYVGTMVIFVIVALALWGSSFR
jgi:O-antigen ligase